MSTTNMHGTVGTSTAAPIIVTFTGAPRLLQLVVDDGAGNHAGHFRYAINGDTVNNTTSACQPASGIAVPVASPIGITSLTIWSNAGEANQVYSIGNVIRFTGS